MSNRMTMKRLLTEFRQITKNPPEGIAAGPMSVDGEDNMFKWEALVT